MGFWWIRRVGFRCFDGDATQIDWIVDRTDWKSPVLVFGWFLDRFGRDFFRDHYKGTCYVD